MTRITKSITTAMQDKAVEKAGIAAARAELNARDNAMTEAMRIEAMGGAENYARLMQLDAKHKKLRESAYGYTETAGRSNLINRESRVNINLAGVGLTRYFFDTTGAVEYRYSLSIAHRHVIEQGHPLVAEFYAIEDAKKELDSREQTIRQSVAAAVGSIGTVKKLLEAWPEAAELLPAIQDGVKTNLPALQVSELNALIGLPSEQVAE